MKDQRQQISRKVLALEDEFLSALRRVMKIPSVKGKAESEAPFGSQPKAAILEALAIGKELGFETTLVNNAMGYVQYGVDDSYIGVIGHLDVVAAGTGWSYAPFDLTIVDGVAYGRGVLDNKGPVISALFALYALKELAVLNKTIRIVFGSDEESGSADVPLYLAQEAPPIYGFTPDCKYPAVYGERGVLGIVIRTTFEEAALADVTSLTGNFDRSAIPDCVDLRWSDGQVTRAVGKRAPSNAPEMGLNSITLLGERVTKEGLGSHPTLRDYFRWLADNLHEQHDGGGLGIAFSDEVSGMLQLSPVELVMNKNELALTISIRYPISVTEALILTSLEKYLPLGSKVEVIRSMPASVFPKNHPMLQVMQEVYEYATGQDGTPVTTTGATYARSMPNIVAFGPSFPGQKGIAHNKDEYMCVADLMKNMEIYALTLAELAK